ncbi:glycosyltransferase family 2 protein [Azospirillum lipoferum]|nr:TIGR00180 family glycosyltransferase [Azospirillum lipoferum]
MIDDQTITTRLTLIITTHEREKFCSRLLRYYAGLPLRILVADSSRMAVNYGNALSPLGSYLHTPEIDYATKMTRCLEQVKTPYVVICADDDFITMAGLEAAVRRLDAIPETAAVQGRCLSFIRDLDRISCIQSYAYARDWTIDAPTPHERQAQVMKLYMHAYYAVHRTPVLKRAMAEVQSGFEHPELREFHITLSAAAAGEIHTLPLLFSVRQALPLSSGAQAGTSYANLLQMRRDGAEPVVFNRFLDCWIRNLVGDAGLSQDAARAAALSAVDRYVEGLPVLRHLLSEPEHHHVDMDELLAGQHPEISWTAADLDLLRPIAQLIREHRDCDDAMPILEDPATLAGAERIFLYGSGEAGLWLLDYLSRRNIIVSGFLDSWQEGMIAGLPRLRYDHYRAQRRPGDLVVVASMHYGPILASLQGVVTAVNAYPLYLARHYFKSMDEGTSMPSSL